MSPQAPIWVPESAPYRADRGATRCPCPHKCVTICDAKQLCKMQLRSNDTKLITKMFVVCGCCVVMELFMSSGVCCLRISSGSNLWEDDRGNRFHTTELHGVLYRTSCWNAVLLDHGLQSVNQLPVAASFWREPNETLQKCPY